MVMSSRRLMSDMGLAPCPGVIISNRPTPTCAQPTAVRTPTRSCHKLAPVFPFGGFQELEPLSKRLSFDRIGRQAARPKQDFSVIRRSSFVPTEAVPRNPHSAVKTRACLAAMLLLVVVPLFTLEADARGGG